MNMSVQSKQRLTVGVVIEGGQHVYLDTYYRVQDCLSLANA